MKKAFLTLLFIIFLFSVSAQDQSYWPAQKATSKPWTRWWWMGSAVNEKNIRVSLIDFHKAGMGGVEIAPIYGVKGQEENYIDYLSPKWISMLNHTLSVADSLGMGVDLTLGTGWPWGGSKVDLVHAATTLLVFKVDLKKGEQFDQSVLVPSMLMHDLVNPLEGNLFSKPNNFLNRKIILQKIISFPKHNKYNDITDLVSSDSLNFKAIESDHTLYFVYEGKTRQQVKRSAPGGNGWVLDHFSSSALEKYLIPYSEALTKVNGKVRAVFNDSYEVYKADYTQDFFNAFIKHRGYDLLPHLPKLFSDISDPDANRIISDYKETLSDLLIEDFNGFWNIWADKEKVKTKYQAHGSPGNLIDLYASADIPECETFGSMPYKINGFRRIQGGGTDKEFPHKNFRAGDADPVMIRFSSSAAHIANKPLVSSETFTWLREHFRTALSQCKPEVEDLFLNGINHVFLHGTTYSPQEAVWPGWKFYASVNFNPNNTIWEDVPALFNYISRAQSLLQLGKPDNEILLYWPIHDAWDNFHKEKKLAQFSIHKIDEWLLKGSFYEAANTLLKRGYTFDYISDRFIEKAQFESGALLLPGGLYKTLVVPDTKIMPLETLKKLITLKEKGASIIFLGLPETVPGFLNYKEGEKEMSQRLRHSKIETHDLNKIHLPLIASEIRAEKLVETGLKFIRRKVAEEKVYFIANHTDQTISGFVPIQHKANGVLFLDPNSGKVGKAITNANGDQTLVKLALASGQTVFIKTYKESDAPMWQYHKSSSNGYPILGLWNLHFLKGGPKIPIHRKIEKLVSWTRLGNDARDFSGTAAYSIAFEKPSNHTGAWLLDLGDVRESAKVWINEEFVGTVWSNPYKIEIKHLKKGKNTLRIHVTNLGANRIKAKEARGEAWKIFNNINVVSLNYKSFDTSDWKFLPSGLLETPVLRELNLE